MHGSSSGMMGQQEAWQQRWLRPAKAYQQQQRWLRPGKADPSMPPLQERAREWKRWKRGAAGQEPYVAPTMKLVPAAASSRAGQAPSKSPATPPKRTDGPPPLCKARPKPGQEARGTVALQVEPPVEGELLKGHRLETKKKPNF